MKNLATIFKRLGYPKHTDRIYEVLVETHEPLLVTTIAQRCAVSRMVVYRCLEKLVENRLVEKSTTGKRSIYAAGSPHALQQAIGLTQEQSKETLSPYIKAREKDVPQNVRFLYGSEGIKAAFDDVISHTKGGETFFRYTSEQDLAKVNTYLAKDYRQRRDKKRLERMVISNYLSGQQKKSRLERFIRFLPEGNEQFEQNIIQLVYGNRISVIDLTTEEVMIVENKRLADFQKSIFRILYKRL
jgi:predicted transcriptional regulator